MFTESDLIEVLTKVQPVVASRFGKKLATLGARVDVDDLMQDVSIKAFASFAGCQAQTVEQLRHWVLTIAKHTCEMLITHHRGRGKRSTRLEQVSIDRTTGETETSFQPVSAIDDPAVLVSIEEELAVVLESLASLPERQAKAIRMKFIEAAEYEQIAADLQVTVGAARTLVSRGIESLRAVAA